MWEILALGYLINDVGGDSYSKDVCLFYLDSEEILSLIFKIKAGPDGENNLVESNL